MRSTPPAPAVAGRFRAALPGPVRHTVVPSPIGDLLLTGDGESVTGLYMLPDQLYRPHVQPDWLTDPGGPFPGLVEELAAYFACELRTFTTPLAPRGTPFQLAVWQVLATIGHGSTTTYAAIAAELGRPTAARAVGMANGRNPVSIVLPCHRVVGTDGSLTGYGGGLPRKRRLLTLENALPAPALALFD